MDCELVQAELSARADGEAAAAPAAAVDRHLRGCAACRHFAEILDGTRLAPLAAAGSADVAGRVVAAAGDADRAGVWTWFRIALFGVAAGELAVALPDLLGHAPRADAHLARHLGAFQVAFAVGLIVVAVRPAKARAMVPQTLALAAAMIGAAIVDVTAGTTPAFGEVEHFLEIAGLLLVWCLATRRGWLRGRGSAAPADHTPGRSLGVVSGDPSAPDRLAG